MEPTNLHSKHSDADHTLRGGLHGQRGADHEQHLSQSVWAACMGFVGDVFKHLREVYFKPDKPNESDKPHRCTNVPERICYCAPGVCADDATTYRYAKLAAKHPRCPVSGQFCAGSSCREWCESGVNRSKT